MDVRPIETVQLAAFDYFITHSVKNVLEGQEIQTRDFSFLLKEVWVAPPVESLRVCKEQNLTYAGDLKAKVNATFKDVSLTAEVSLGSIPLMVGCRLSDPMCVTDAKCYFVVKGQQKFVSMEERISYNHIFVLSKLKEFKFDPCVEFKSIFNFFRSSFLDLGCKQLANGTKQILVYCPDLVQKTTVGIHTFLRLFLTEEEIRQRNTDLLRTFPAQHHTRLAEVIFDNFSTPTVDVKALHDLIYRANSKLKKEGYTINQIIRDKFLIHMGGCSNAQKGEFTFIMLKVLYKAIVGIVKKDNRDHYGNKRAYTTVNYFTQQLNHIYHKKFIKRCIKTFDDTSQLSEEVIVRNFEKCCDITTSLRSCLTSNKWYAKFATNQNVSQPFECYNRHQYYEINKINTPVKSENNKIGDARDYHLTQADILCPYSTPDGKKVGLIKHFSAQTHLSVDKSLGFEDVIRNLVRSTPTINAEGVVVDILVNGIFIGSVVRVSREVEIAVKIIFERVSILDVVPKRPRRRRCLCPVKHGARCRQTVDTLHSRKMALLGYKLKTRIWSAASLASLFDVGGQLSFSDIMQKIDALPQCDLVTMLGRLSSLKTTFGLHDVSVFYDGPKELILVLSDAGRLMYPVCTKPIDADAPTSYTRLLNKGYIQLLDKNELEMFKVLEEDIFTIDNKRKKPSSCAAKTTVLRYMTVDGYGATVVESLLPAAVPQAFKFDPPVTDFIFPLTLGHVGSLTPFSNYNQSPRNIYQCQMARQSMSFIPYGDRPNVYNQLCYPQTAIVSTLFAMREDLYTFPTGENVVLAICPYMGCNQEDSIVLNKASVDRGLFMSTRDTTLSYILENDEILYSPDPSVQSLMHNYSKLDDNGIVRERIHVSKNDVLVCVKKSKTDEMNVPNPVLVFTCDTTALVSSVTKLVNEKNDTTITIIVSEMLLPKVGDKFSSRHGQKGTVALIASAHDLPFFADGTQPDLIMSPIAIPSRMTIGHQHELAVGMMHCTRSEKKLCAQCVEHKRTLSCPRCESDCFITQHIKHELFHNAFYRDLFVRGSKHFESTVMYSGMTGERVHAKIYRGVIQYQRLKHVAGDKMNTRTTGPVQKLSRQPKEGRSVEGGYKFGVQERDTLLAHGAAISLCERIFFASDPYSLRVCKCGLIYHGFTKKSEFAQCTVCESMDLRVIRLPYSTKALVQMMMGFNVCLRFIPS